MIGQTISHYKILEKLGEGGMGVVYKAEDLKLDRLVALKFLPSHLAADPQDKTRFIHEAKAASALDHPNICTIYGIDETPEGQLFLAMAYYEGKTLTDKITNAPLKIDEALDIAIQVAEGLRAAHEKEIVHRDIKSSNIMITEQGQAKITDFGLAKRIGATQLTKTGATVGTVPYMSPEQARGEKVDHRTDIWSLGVVLYEMITGRLPFRSEYSEAVVYSILNEESDPLTSLRSDVPMELEQITKKAMQKNASERYQHVDEMLVDLKALNKKLKKQEPRKLSLAEILVLKKRPWFLRTILGVTIVAALSIGYLILSQEADSGERVSIAVVDFVNETKEEELNGLSGMLITSLEQSRRLSVLTRSRMLDFAKQIGKEDIDRIDENLGSEICKRANVNVLAIASIRKLGRRYIIDLKVIDPNKNEYLVAAKEEGEDKESISLMIDKLAEKARGGLKEKLTEIQAANKRVAEITTMNLEAYHHYFLGEQFVNKLKWKEAEAEFRKAVALDSTFAMAYYRIAYVLTWRGRAGADEPIRKAMQYLHKAPEKERYFIRARNASIELNIDEAIAIYEDLLKLYPEEKEALFEVGDILFHRGNIAKGITYFEKVLMIDATFERALQHIVWAYELTWQFDEMLRYAREYVARIPSSEEAYNWLADAYTVRNDFDSAMQTYQSALEVFPKSPMPIIGIAGISFLKNEFKRVEEEYKKLFEQSRPLSHKKIGYIGLALINAYRGRYREALKMLDKVSEIEASLVETEAEGGGQSYVAKGFWLATAWKDEKKAFHALEEAQQLKWMKNTVFNFFLFHAYVQISEYQKALSLAQNELWFTYPYLDLIVSAYTQRKRGEHADAIKDFELYTERIGTIFTKLYFGYDVAESYLQIGENEKAVEMIQGYQNMRSNFAGWPGYPGYIFGSLFFHATYDPKSFYLLGKIYEKKGDTKLAIENYEKFLTLWKDADKDLPELMEAKARLAKLKGPHPDDKVPISY